MARILLVEDDRWLAECYSAWLSSAGHAPVHVTDAQAALDVLDDTPADAILLDMLLPRANGVQLLNQLRSYADLSRIPIIICSSSPPNATDAQAYGVVAVLDKTTLTPRKLRDTINAYATPQN